MNYIYRLADKNRQPPQTLLCVLISLVILMLMALAMIINTTYRIQAYAEIPTKVLGRLDDVSSGPYKGFLLHIDGNPYVVRKESTYSKRSFGIAGNRKLFDFRDLLEVKIGDEVQIEYVQEGSERIVVMLFTNGIEYINKDVAINDFIGYNRTIRTIGIAGLCLLIILFVLVWKGIIR